MHGKDDALGPPDDGRVAGHGDDLGRCNVLQRLCHRTQVAHTVVDHCNVNHEFVFFACQQPYSCGLTGSEASLSGRQHATRT
jgi:hypothetical protein